MEIRIRVDSDFDKVAKAVRDAMPDAAKAMADVIYEGSQTQVPVDTGDLKRSGKVEVRKAKNEAVVSYGDESKVRYAGIVHEQTGVRHRVGKRAYLRDPAMENSRVPQVGGLGKAAAKVLEKAVKDAGGLYTGKG